MIDLDLIREKIIKPESLIDLGVGFGTGAKQLWSFFKNVPVKVGLDISKESLLKHRKDFPNGVFIVAEGYWINQLFLDKSFDLVMAIHFLEHFPKGVGLKLIKKMENLAKKQVLIVVPFPYTESEGHLSNWFKEDFETLGYEVFESLETPCHLLAIKNLGASK
ncbi:MAG: class I SAM-dependent methyltransferase [Archaeoglobaceae archaeon]|nr:class I SAM-dependent methyltransferase [Archaeoglobaceae archaeon]